MNAHTCLFGGALIAAGLAAHADAQCDLNADDGVSSSYPPGYDYNYSYGRNLTDFGVSDGRFFTVNFGYGVVTTPAYTFVQEYRLRIYDTTDPSNVTLLSESAPLGGSLFEDVVLGEEQTIHVIGNTLAGTVNNIIRLWDITDPVNPQIVNEIDLPGSQSQIWEENGLLFCQTFNPSRIHVLDISNPLSPQTLDVFTPPNAGFRMGRPSGNRLPIGYNEGVPGQTVAIIDISDPTDLQFEASLPVPIGTPIDPVMVGNAVVLNSGSFGGLHVVDFTDPGNPVQRPDIPYPGGSINTSFTSNGFFLFASSSFELESWDLTDPANPIKVAGPVSNFRQNRLAADGGILTALSDDRKGGAASIFDISACSVLPTVINSPLSRLADESTNPEVFSVNASATTDFQWMRDNVPLANGGDFAGVNTANLSVLPHANTEGVYTCTVSNSDGQDTSAPALLGVRAGAPTLPGCNAADLVIPFGVLDLDDIDAFINAFSSNCP